jgi:hypothetical protein
MAGAAQFRTRFYKAARFDGSLTSTAADASGSRRSHVEQVRPRMRGDPTADRSLEGTFKAGVSTGRARCVPDGTVSRGQRGCQWPPVFAAVGGRFGRSASRSRLNRPVIPKLRLQASGAIPMLSKCARVASRHASADASSDLKNDSVPRAPPETITIQRCPRDLSPSALKTTEHPRSASHPISSTTSTSAPSKGIVPATGMRPRRAVSGPYEGDQAERLH